MTPAPLFTAVCLAALLAGCADRSRDGADAHPMAHAPMLVMPHGDPDAMQTKADAFCETHGMDAQRAGRRWVSVFGKRGGYGLRIVWTCVPRD